MLARGGQPLVTVEELIGTSTSPAKAEMAVNVAMSATPGKMALWVNQLERSPHAARLRRGCQFDRRSEAPGRLGGAWSRAGPRTRGLAPG